MKKRWKEENEKRKKKRFLAASTPLVLLDSKLLKD